MCGGVAIKQKAHDCTFSMVFDINVLVVLVFCRDSISNTNHKYCDSKDRYTYTQHVAIFTICLAGEFSLPCTFGQFSQWFSVFIITFFIYLL